MSSGCTHTEVHTYKEIGDLNLEMCLLSSKAEAKISHHDRMLLRVQLATTLTCHEIVLFA